MITVDPETASCVLWKVTGSLVLVPSILQLVRYCKKPKWLNMFYVWLGALAILGGTWAFFLPIAINSGFNKDDDGPVLRQLLIYTVGGILGVITLGETHRKNNLEKDKNDQDHARQVHAERRSRYTKAIEHLFNENISIRLGGVYTLTGLADEWLSDEKTLRNEKERRKETQNIINNLCTYIRSPFPLAERAEQLDKDYAKDLQNDFGGDIEKFDTDKQVFARDKATLEEERQVRESIIKEIRERLQDFGTPGPWSNFDYDFSNAHFFYSTVFMNSHFKTSPTFFGATFEEGANFFGTTFEEGANFVETTFNKAANNESANFMEATFMKKAHFCLATFTGDANFTKATFEEDSNYTGAKDDRFFWTTDANFVGATFNQGANFSKAIFWTKPIFNDESYTARFSNKAKLESYNFQVSHSSPYKIDTEDHRSPDGTITTIPKGCIVFDSKTGKEVPHTPAPNGSV